VNAVAVELAVEELHFLAAAHGVAAVPGLGPLPAEPDDEKLLNFLAGTAARSLIARGLGIYDAAGEFQMATELIPLFDAFAEPDWIVSAIRLSPDERGSRTWTARGSDVAGLLQLSVGHYALVSRDLDDVPFDIEEFLELTGEDDGEDEPVELDESSVGVLVEARRVVRVGEGVEGVAFEWVDRGDGGRVLVLSEDHSDDEDAPVMVVPTGRRRLLAQLAY
jgi:hypothetical protein